MASRLKRKLEENRERRERELLLEKMPDEWSEKLEKSNYLFSFDFFDNFPLSIMSPLDNVSFFDDKTVIHGDYDRKSDAITFVGSLDIMLEPPIHIWLGSGPVFELDNPLDSRTLVDLIKGSEFMSVVVEKNLSKGLICHDYLGYLEPERMTNNNELIFDVFYYSSLD